MRTVSTKSCNQSRQLVPHNAVRVTRPRASKRSMPPISDIFVLSLETLVDPQRQVCSMESRNYKFVYHELAGWQLSVRAPGNVQF